MAEEVKVGAEPDSGERIVPGQVEQSDWISHTSRYDFASRFTAGRDVLDIACGMGYGSYMLAMSGAKSVVGVDISPEAVEFGSANYQAPGLRFAYADGDSGSFQPGSFDVVVSFETIEHTARPEVFLANLASYLRPGGILVMSTPNRDALMDGMTSFSPHHVREFDRPELDALLRKHFGEIEYHWQPWPLRKAYAKKRVDRALEAAGLKRLKRLIPRGLKNAILGVLSRPSGKLLTREYLSPHPWSELPKIEDACFIIAVARQAEVHHMEHSD